MKHISQLLCVALAICLCMACKRAPNARSQAEQQPTVAAPLPVGSRDSERVAKPATEKTADIALADSSEVQRLLQTDIVDIQGMSTVQTSNLVERAVLTLGPEQKVRLARLLSSANRYASAVQLLENALVHTEEPSALVVVYHALGEAHRDMILMASDAHETFSAESSAYQEAISAQKRIIENPQLYLGPAQATSESELAYDLAFNRLKDLYLAVEHDANKVMELCDIYEKEIARLSLPDAQQRVTATRAQLYGDIGLAMCGRSKKQPNVLISEGNIRELEIFARTAAAAMPQPLETRLGNPATKSVRQNIQRGLRYHTKDK
jgi:hypothetical protein